MDKLRKIGLTALAGTFAATSAQALEMSVSGSAGFTFATADNDETTGNRFSFGDSLTFSGSGETDQGWNVSVSIEADGASAK
jgi:outer membrane protein OmpU